MPEDVCQHFLLESRGAQVKYGCPDRILLSFTDLYVHNNYMFIFVSVGYVNTYLASEAEDRNDSVQSDIYFRSIYFFPT